MIPNRAKSLAIISAFCGLTYAAQAERAVLDIYTCYSTEKKNAEGGTNQIRANILTSFAKFNQINAASGVDMRVNPVGLEEVSYQVGTKSDLDVLIDVSDNQVAAFQDRRVAWGADLVTFITKLEFCGRAWVPGNSSVVDCLTNHTLAHEIGHNFGLGHGEGIDPGITTWAEGRKFTGNDGVSYKTVMIGNREAESTLVYKWSSPNVFHQGVPTGVADKVDSVRQLRDYTFTQTSREKINPEGKGEWVILNRYSDKAVHKGGKSTENGIKLTQWRNIGTTNMLWAFEDSPVNGWMNVRNIQSGLYMDSKTSTANGTPMTQFQRLPYVDQQNYVLDSNDDGYVRIRCKKAGKILHNPRTLANGTVISQWRYNGATHLQYEVRFVP